MITTLPQLTLPVSFSFKSLCVKSCCYFQSFILLFLLLVIGKSSHGQADLAITISAAPEPVKDNGKVTFTIKVTNNGPGAALNPKVQTTILSTFDRNSFSFDTQASGWTGFYTYASGVLSLSNSNSAGFASGASATFVYTVNATAAATGTVQTTTATVSSSTVDPDMSNDTTTVKTTVLPAATFNYYRTRQSGKWNDVNTWETSVDNLSWTNATLTPNFNAKAIIVRSTHAVTVTVNVTAIRTTVSVGGKLNINPGVNFTVR